MWLPAPLCRAYLAEDEAWVAAREAKAAKAEADKAKAEAKAGFFAAQREAGEAARKQQRLPRAAPTPAARRHVQRRLVEDARAGEGEAQIVERPRRPATQYEHARRSGHVSTAASPASQAHSQPAPVVCERG